MSVSEEMLAIMACSVCRSPLEDDEETLHLPGMRRPFPGPRRYSGDAAGSRHPRSEEADDRPCAS